MSRGRCAGCGLEDASCKKIRSHVASCPEFIKLWTESPEKAIDPEQEFARHKAYLKSDEYEMARDEKRATKHAGYRAEAEAKIARSKLRWGSHLTTNEVQVVHSHGGSSLPPDEDEPPSASRLVDGRDPQEILDDPSATKMQKLRAEIALSKK